MTNEQIIERLAKAELEYMGHTEQGDLVAKALPAQWTALLAPADTVTISRELAEKAGFELSWVVKNARACAEEAVDEQGRVDWLLHAEAMQELQDALRQALSPLANGCPMCGSTDPYHLSTTCEWAGDGE